MRHSIALVVSAALALAAAPHLLPAQVPAANAVYLEILGSGGLYSLNFERRVSALHMRVGFGSWSGDDLFGAGESEIVSVPLTLSHLRGTGNHHLESGGGLTLGNRKFTSAFDESTTSSGFVTLTGLVGYRYQKPSGGLIVRALFTPLFGLGEEDKAYPDRGFTPSVGFSLGYAF